jgi:glycosyltransferase involved in cell wall biosynthesis
MKILFLYSEVMGYTLGVLKALVQEHSCSIYLVYWDKKKKTPFQIDSHIGVTLYPRSQFTNANAIYSWASSIQPDLVYISGRMDSAYLQVSLKLKKKGIPIVSGLDNQWKGSLRQYAASFFAHYFYKRYFDYLWVPGPLQYAYALRLGYKPAAIIQNLYSADTALFTSKEESQSSNTETRTLLFVGRLDPVKGIEAAIHSFIRMQAQSRYNWNFKVIGSGPLEGKLPMHSTIEYIPFLQPSALSAVVRDSTVFILPSVQEPWGVVVHEMAAAGLPLLCSDAVGANTSFLIDGYNGSIFRSNNASDLDEKMLRILNRPIDELDKMGENSQLLSQRITPEIAAYSIISIVKK